jgi:GNAT superfamily N-acetyltransferase
VESAEAAHAAGLAQLFASNGYGCYCRYWHFQGTAREWLERCAQRAEENESEMREALCAGSEAMRGVVAVTASSELVGWLKLAPARILGKLYGQRLYKGLPCFEAAREGTWTVGCLLVREDFRRRGVATALLAGAISTAPAWGARALEAFPRSDTGVADAALMLGPARLFSNAGFELVHDFFPYPVLRRELTSPGQSF